MQFRFNKNTKLNPAIQKIYASLGKTMEWLGK